MTIKIKRGAEQTVIEIAGKLDAITAPALDKTICEVVADAKHLVLDVQGVEYISSEGLGVLLNAQKKMQKKGSMQVINACAEVRELFETTGFAEVSY